jgi:transcriptional regulator of aromatic amino acid metabolism
MTSKRPAFVSFSEAEWRQFLIEERRRPNLLISCTSDEIEPVVAMLMGLCARPVHTRNMPCVLNLPKGTTGTLLLWDVAQLTRRQQIELHDWITDRPENMQVISITSTALLPLVEDGRFLEALFYRINVLTLVVTVGNHRPGGQADPVSQVQQEGTPAGGAVQTH